MTGWRSARPKPPGAARRATSACLLCLTACFACATAEVAEVEGEEGGSGLARPERVLVFDFASSPDDVALNRGIPARIARRVAANPSDAKAALGRRAALIVSNRLIDGLWSFGIPAEPADDRTPLRPNDLVLTGQFVTVDEGNRIAPTAIGFGADESEVRARVQLYWMHGEEAKLVNGFHTIARSARPPSVAAGAMEIADESVEADARRAADAIVNETLRFFIGQNWLPPNALQ
ncbi:MAG TPA: DUF4410 domain-containing protein [Myxococcota bacterium]